MPVATSGRLSECDSVHSKEDCYGIKCPKDDRGLLTKKLKGHEGDPMTGQGWVPYQPKFRYSQEEDPNISVVLPSNTRKEDSGDDRGERIEEDPNISVVLPSNTRKEDSGDDRGERIVTAQSNRTPKRPRHSEMLAAFAKRPTVSLKDDMEQEILPLGTPGTPETPVPQRKDHSDNSSRFYVTRERYDDLKSRLKKLERKVALIEGKMTSNDQPQPEAAQPQVQPQLQLQPQPQVQPQLQPQPQVQPQLQPQPQHQPQHQLQPQHSEMTFNGHLYSELVDAVSLTDTESQAVCVIMKLLFSDEYIISHSVTGQPSNRQRTAKPKFDVRLFNTMVKVVKVKFPEINRSTLTQKVHQVKKKITRVMAEKS